jgi:hypothetical protein
LLAWDIDPALDPIEYRENIKLKYGRRAFMSGEVSSEKD